MGGGGMDPQDLFSQLFGGGGGFFGGGGGESIALTLADIQEAEAADLDVERISFTESAFPWRTSTRAKSKSSPYRSRSFVKDAKAEVERRVRSNNVPPVEVKVSRLCFDSSVR